MERSLFYSTLPNGIEPRGKVEQRLLAEYGAIFVAQNVQPPTRIVFRDETDVAEFQSNLSTAAENISGFRLELQSPAMGDLRLAISEAESSGLSISPRDSDSARRNYNETVGLWASRVEPALNHWVANGRLSATEAQRIRALSPFEQVPEVLKLEENGIYFAKDLSKSIIYSVAPPGTSQHLSLLALDVKEHDDPQVRALLARNNWFQTVVSDLPHFTFLGVAEDRLPQLGLKKVRSGSRDFWIPDI